LNLLSYNYRFPSSLHSGYHLAFYLYQSKPFSFNREGPQSFFDLTKGQRIATQAQKEKQHLAWKRNHALRQEHQKALEEAKADIPQWQCKACGHKFASHKAVK
jgi:hypothetical protein